MLNPLAVSHNFEDRLLDLKKSMNEEDCPHQAIFEAAKWIGAWEQPHVMGDDDWCGEFRSRSETDRE